MVIRASAPVRIDLAGAWTDCAPFSDEFGGATLTIAVSPRVTGTFATGEGVDGLEGATLTYSSPVPIAAGLGSSAAMNVVWLALARGLPVSTLEDRCRIAELAYATEQTLGIIGGRQDQYSSACGGIRLYRFQREGTTTARVEVPAPVLDALLSRLVVLFTGRSRLSSAIHRDVWSRFSEGDPGVISALRALRASAERCAAGLEAGDLAALGEVLNEQTRLMLALSPATRTPGLEEVASLAGDLVLGAKPTGAGGGGCVLLLCTDPDARCVVARLGRDRGWREIPVTLDDTGLTVEVEGSVESA